MVLPIVRIVQRDRYKSDTVSLSCRYKTSAALFCKSRLDSDSSVIRPQKLVVVYKQPCLVVVAERDLGFVSGDDLFEFGILQRVSRKLCKIRGCCVMIL